MKMLNIFNYSLLYKDNSDNDYSTQPRSTILNDGRPAL